VKVLGKGKEEEKNKLHWPLFFLFLFEIKILLFAFSLIQNITSFKLNPFVIVRRLSPKQTKPKT
jgi:hypothetical protein